MKYYCVIVPEYISKDKEIYLNADKVYVNNGDLELIRMINDQPSMALSLSKGNWHGYYEASCIDGHAYFITYWKEHLNSPGIRAE